jgi:hypothetical protein
MARNTSVYSSSRRDFLKGAATVILIEVIATIPIISEFDIDANDEKVIALTLADVINLKKIASTEVVQSLRGAAFTNQVHGVVDTVLNRLVSGKWGDSVADVGNAPWQFSGINSNLRSAYGSLEDMPANHIKKKVALEVDRWLEKRAAGEPSSVSNHLNYLNPHHSSTKSLKEWGWDVVRQAKAEGLVYGRGRAVHYHGTAAGNERWRPAKFRIKLPEE